jgi:hypothetical protein
MAKKNNDGKGQTSGFGSTELVTPDATKLTAGARSNTDADWVRKDRVWKEFGTARTQYS